MTDHDQTPPVDRKLRARIAKQNREAANGAIHNGLNGLGYPPMWKQESGLIDRNLPPLNKLTAPPYGYTRSGVRRRTRGIWLPILLILLSLAVLAGVWLSYKHWTGLADPAEYNCLSIVQEEAPVLASPPLIDSATEPITNTAGASSPADNVEGGGDAWVGGGGSVSPLSVPTESSAPPPDAYMSYVYYLRVTWYGPPDFPASSGVCRGGSIRSWMDRAAELGLDGICAAGDVNGTTWYEDAKYADPPIALCISEAGTFLLVDRMRRDLQRVDIWRESDPPWPDYQNVWEVPISTVQTEVE